MINVSTLLKQHFRPPMSFFTQATAKALIGEVQIPSIIQYDGITRVMKPFSTIVEAHWAPMVMSVLTDAKMGTNGHILCLLICHFDR